MKYWKKQMTLEAYIKTKEMTFENYTSWNIETKQMTLELSTQRDEICVTVLISDSDLHPPLTSCTRPCCIPNDSLAYT